MNFLHNFQSAEWILNTAFQSMAVLMIGWLFLKLFKQKSAPLRSATVILTLLLLAVMPLLNFPSFALVPKTFGSTLSVNISSLPAAPSMNTAPSPLEAAEIPVFKGDHFTGQTEGTKEKARLGSLWLIIINIFGLLWIAVAAVFLLRFLVGTLSIPKLKKGISEADYPQIDQILTDAQSVFPTPIDTKIYASTQINTPMALGFFKPYILIPSSSLKRMSSKKYVQKLASEPLSERGGRSRYYYRITPEGAAELEKIRSVHSSLWNGVLNLSFEDKAE